MCVSCLCGHGPHGQCWLSAQVERNIEKKNVLSVSVSPNLLIQLEQLISHHLAAPGGSLGFHWGRGNLLLSSSALLSWSQPAFFLHRPSLIMHPYCYYGIPFKSPDAFSTATFPPRWLAVWNKYKRCFYRHHNRMSPDYICAQHHGQTGNLAKRKWHR